MTVGGQSQLALEAGSLSPTKLQGVYDVNIVTNAAEVAANYWTFDTDGNLTLPQTNMTSSPAPTSWPGITFSDGTFQNTAAGGNPLTVSETAFGSLSNVVANVTAIRFDGETGFNVEDLGSGEVKVSLGSSFKTWLVDSQDSLVASGEDTVEIIAGTGVILETHATSPKSLTISADSLVNLDGGSAGSVYDTPVVYADGGGASTRFGVNSVVFDGESTTPGAIDYNLNGGRA